MDNKHILMVYYVPGVLLSVHQNLDIYSICGRKSIDGSTHSYFLYSFALVSLFYYDCDV